MNTSLSAYERENNHCFFVGENSRERSKQSINHPDYAIR